jgi:hypothetical protein
MAITLNDINVGDYFVLNRTGEKYKKGGEYFFKGKPTKRFYVYPVSESKITSKPETLSLQCEITLQN